MNAQASALRFFFTITLGIGAPSIEKRVSATTIGLWTT